jgi:hypothetical protein
MTELTSKHLKEGSLKRMPLVIARRFLLLVIGGALLAGIAFAQSAVTPKHKLPRFESEADTKDRNDPDLTGAWTTTATPPAESGVPAFKLLFTFTADGNLLATGTGGESPALGNPCHGVWTKTGEHSFAVTYLCLDFDSSLQFTGTDKIRGALTIDKKTGKLRGQLDLTHFDTDDNLIFNACCAGLQGSSVEVEQLP